MPLDNLTSRTISLLRVIHSTAGRTKHLVWENCSRFDHESRTEKSPKKISSMQFGQLSAWKRLILSKYYL